MELVITNMDLRTYLNQTEFWLPKPVPGGTREFIRISDMTEEHRAFAARWLGGRAQAMIMLVEGSMNEDLMDPGETETHLGDVLSLLAQNPRDWIRNTPLFRAIVEDIPRSMWVPEFHRERRGETPAPDLQEIER